MSTLAAQQQVLVSSVASRPESSLLESIAPAPDASVRNSTSLATDSVLPQMLSPNPLYEAALPQLPSAVCTQALFPTIGLPPSDYVFDHLTLSSSAIKGAFTHDHMVKMARNFVPSQPLPDTPSYVPMTSRQKFDGWMHHTYSFDMFSGAAIDSLILQATGAYRDYGGGMQGFTKRYGTQLLSNEAGSLFGRWLFPTILHQDTRYYPSGQTRILDRMAYAVSRTVITRSDSGNNVFNSSLLLTLLFTSALANGYKPNYDESFQATMANTFAGLGATAQINLLNEFWPDLKDLFTQHQPTKSIAHQVSRQIDRWTGVKKPD